MTYPGHNPHLFRWKALGTRKTSRDKVHVKKDDIDQWRKRVEMASEFAVSEVFSRKKPRTGTNGQPVPLQTSDQLRDHDDAYNEAQGLLSDWLSSKLRLELQVEEEEEDDLACSAERRSPAVLANAQPGGMNYTNFNDLYNHLAEEEEGGTVNSVFQDLMERELLDCGVMEELALDVGQTRKKFRDPIITMEARHMQVRENRARREAERQRQHREREALRDAREAAKSSEQRERVRKKQGAQREEDMIKQEMVRLRRQMEEKRCNEQLLRLRERERMEGQRAARSLQSVPPSPTKQLQQQDIERLCREQNIQTKVHMHNLKCLQRHFSGWYSEVLDRRLRMGKARALHDWKRQLRAWRAWQAVVWAEQKKRELARTEEQLRTENRQCQLAVESDRKRLLRACLKEWQLWCRMEKEQRELLAQQQETRSKMAALINAASTGVFKGTETPTYQPVTARPEESKRLDTTEKKDHHRSGTLALNTSAEHRNKTPVGPGAHPTQPWQVTRRHAAPTAAELHEARQRGEGSVYDPPKSAASHDGRFENRHAVQQQIITQQRKLLKEQQEQIAQLRQQQSVIGSELELEKTTQFAQLSKPGGSRPKSHNAVPTEQRRPRVAGEPDILCAPQRKPVTLHTGPHPIIAAMEARARQRAERRKEIEALKRKKEGERLAELEAAEEQRQREEEEERRKAAEKRKEEKRQEREREEEKQRQLKRQQELLMLARRHYHRNVLLQRGLAPWKRLVQLRQANIRLAEGHHNLFLLRRLTLAWQQSATESLSEKKASADQLYQHFLLQRSLSCWKRLKDRRVVQAERAERFYRIRTLRRFLSALLDHVTRERLAELDRQEAAQEHSDRRVVSRCFLAWRQLPCLLRIERVKEKRREKLGRKVAEVLPDFCSHPL